MLQGRARFELSQRSRRNRRTDIVKKWVQFRGTLVTEYAHVKQPESREFWLFKCLANVKVSSSDNIHAR